MAEEAPFQEDNEVALGATERLTFFSDAVVAIAMTLLALELTVPEGSTTAELWDSAVTHREEYLAFGISFAVVAAHWTSHHRVFRYLRRADDRLRWLNMLWLFTMVVTPFATRVLTPEKATDVPDHSTGARFAFYALIQVVSDGAFIAMIYRMDKADLLVARIPPNLIDGAYWRTGSLAAAFLVSVPLFFVNEYAWVLWIVIPQGVPWLRRAWTRRHDRSAGPGSDASPVVQ